MPRSTGGRTRSIPGLEPWAELAGYRNRLAHALPGDLSSDRIWTDTTADSDPSSPSYTVSAERRAIVMPPTECLYPFRLLELFAVRL